MRIRPATDEDADAVAALWTEAYTGRGQGGRTTPYERAEFFESARALVLWSRPYQAAAHRLYESLGYRRAPERDHSDEDGRRLVFVLDLTGRRRAKTATG